MNKPRKTKQKGGLLPWARAHAPQSLLLALYAAALLGYLLWQAGALVANRLDYRSGRLATASLTVEDFELADLEQREGYLLSLGGDPQLLLKDTQRRVENLELDIDYSLPPLLETAYWARPGQDYSQRQMAYSKAGGLFLLPARGGQSLRIDPGTQPGNQLVVNSIVINQPRPALWFFVPTAGQVALLAVVPGLLGCLAATLWRAREGGGAHG